MNYKRTLPLALSLMVLCATGRLEASFITVNFTAGLTYDPTAVVTASGAKAGDIIGQVFGLGSSGPGTAQVRATLTYESSTAPFQQAPVGSTGSVADYLGPVTTAQLGIGSSTVTPNVPLINSSTSSGAFASGISATTACFGATAFVASFCPSSGLTVNPTNGAFVTNNIDVFTTLPNGTTITKSTDSFALYLGGTAGSLEFSPTLSAGPGGSVHVKSLFVGIIGKPGEDLFPSSALPQSLVLTDLSRIDNTLVQVLLDGPGLTSPMLLQGSATSLNVGPAAVPEPGTLFLLGGGLGLVAWRARPPGHNERKRTCIGGKSCRSRGQRCAVCTRTKWDHHDLSGVSWSPFTVFLALNRAGDAVGYSTLDFMQTFGFKRSATGTYTRFDVPGELGLGTIALGFNEAGTIVGYTAPSIDGFRGFIRNPDGSFQMNQFQAPWTRCRSRSTTAARSWEDRDAAGWHGFVQANGAVTT